MGITSEPLKRIILAYCANATEAATLRRKKSSHIFISQRRCLNSTSIPTPTLQIPQISKCQCLSVCAKTYHLRYYRRREKNTQGTRFGHLIQLLTCRKNVRLRANPVLQQHFALRNILNTYQTYKHYCSDYGEKHATYSRSSLCSITSSAYYNSDLSAFVQISIPLFPYETQLSAQ